MPHTRQETIDSHNLPGHHVFAEKSIDSRQVCCFRRKMFGLHNRGLGFNGVLRLSGLLNKGFFLNSLVSYLSKTLRHALRRLVPQRC